VSVSFSCLSFVFYEEWASVYENIYKLRNVYLKMQNQEILREFASLEESSSFISKNFLSLQKKYGNKFIAVKGPSLLVVAGSFQEVLKELKEKKVDNREVIVQFIPEVGQIILY
jgi:hypothetical protein